MTTPLSIPPPYKGAPHGTQVHKTTINKDRRENLSTSNVEVTSLDL